MKKQKIMSILLSGVLAASYGGMSMTSFANVYATENQNLTVKSQVERLNEEVKSTIENIQKNKKWASSNLSKPVDFKGENKPLIAFLNDYMNQADFKNNYDSVEFYSNYKELASLIETDENHSKAIDISTYPVFNSEGKVETEKTDEDITFTLNENKSKYKGNNVVIVNVNSKHKGDIYVTLDGTKPEANNPSSFLVGNKSFYVVSRNYDKGSTVKVTARVIDKTTGKAYTSSKELTFESGAFVDTADYGKKKEVSNAINSTYKVGVYEGRTEGSLKNLEAAKKKVEDNINNYNQSYFSKYVEELNQAVKDKGRPAVNINKRGYYKVPVRVMPANPQSSTPSMASSTIAANAYIKTDKKGMRLYVITRKLQVGALAGHITSMSMYPAGTRYNQLESKEEQLKGGDRSYMYPDFMGDQIGAYYTLYKFSLKEALGKTDDNLEGNRLYFKLGVDAHNDVLVDIALELDTEGAMESEKDKAYDDAFKVYLDNLEEFSNRADNPLAKELQPKVEILKQQVLEDEDTDDTEDNIEDTIQDYLEKQLDDNLSKLNGENTEDGTYEGSSTIRGVRVKGRVTLEKGVIKEFTMIDEPWDSSKYFRKHFRSNSAKETLKNFIAMFKGKSSSEIGGLNDSITGATLSKKAMKNIVKEGFFKANKAYKEKEELNSYKETGKEKIASLKYLDEDKKTIFKNMISSGDSKDYIDKIVEKAKTEDVKVQKEQEEKTKELKKKQEEVKTAIGKLGNLEEIDKNTFLTKIEEAKEVSVVEQVLSEAKAKDSEIAERKAEEERQKAEALKQKKEEGKEKLKSLSNLGEEDRKSFLARIEETEDILSIDPIVEEAKEKDAKAKEKSLETLKGEAKAEIEGLTHLQSMEKTKYYGQLMNAKSSERVEEILNNAKALDRQREEASKIPTPEEEALQDKKAEATEELGKLTNLSDKKANEYLEKIEKAKTVDEVDTILNEAKAENSAEAGTGEGSTAGSETPSGETTGEQETAGGDAGSTGGGTSEEQPAVIPGTTEENPAEETGQPSQSDGNEALEDAKNHGKLELEKLNKLRDDDYNSYVDRIEKATTAEQVEAIIAEAKAKNDESEGKETGNQGAGSETGNSGAGTTEEQPVTPAGSGSEDTSEALQDAKNNANEELDNLTNLSDDEANAYLDRIEKATTAEQIEAIIAEAKAKNDESEGKNTGNQGADSETGNSGAGTTEEQPVTPAGSGSEDTNTSEALQDAKNNANEELDNLTNLSDDEANVYLDRIDKATTVTQVNEILDEAKAKNEALGGENALNIAREDGKTAINGLQNLSSQQKEEYIAKVEKADSKDAVNTIVASAKEADEQIANNAKIELGKAKDAAIGSITVLRNLTSSEKETYTNQVDSATSAEEVKKVVKAAEAADTAKASQNEAKLAKIKQQAIERIKSFTYLSPERQEYYIQQLNNIVGPAQLPKILNDAQKENNLAKKEAEKAEQALQAKKTQAIATVEGLEKLDSQAKAKYKDDINKAATTTEIDNIVAEAEAKNNEAVSTTEGENQPGETTSPTTEEPGTTGGTTAGSENPSGEAGNQGAETGSESRNAGTGTAEGQPTGETGTTGKTEGTQGTTTGTIGNQETGKPEITVTPKDDNLVVTKVEGVSQETLASISSPEAKAQVESMLKGDYEVYEITLEGGHKENETYLVGIPYNTSKDVVKIAHIKNNGEVEFFGKDNFTLKDGKVYVNAKGLSPFIIEYTAKAKAETSKATPKTAAKTGDNTPLTVSIMFTMALAALTGLFIRKKKDR